MAKQPDKGPASDTAPSKPPTRQTVLRLPEDLAVHLDALSDLTGASRNSLLVEALRDALRHPNGPWTRRAADMRTARHKDKPQP